MVVLREIPLRAIPPAAWRAPAPKHAWVTVEERAALMK